jgi:mevalonate kinase
MQKSYHANGKLLLSAEYLVLKGALSLAVPLIKGQRLTVEIWPQKGLLWRAYTLSGLWFDATFDNELNLVSSSSSPHAERLQNILKQAVAQELTVAEKLINQKVTTQLDFDPQWGWGSSSTLLSLLAQWLQIDPYPLMAATFGGSGYDLACATAGSPIFYRRDPAQAPEISTAPFNPPFMNQLGVVWLNQKQTSSEEVRRFLRDWHTNRDLLEEASYLTREMATAESAEYFGQLLQQHEELIGRATGQTPVQQRLFPDFNGNVKSLGAWGGDFVLFVSPDSFSKASFYFADKGYNTIFPLGDLLLTASPQKTPVQR